MGLDAVAIGSIASVVVAIIVVGAIVYNIVKKAGDKSDN